LDISFVIIYRISKNMIKTYIQKINIKIVKLREYQKVKGYESYLKKKDTYVHCEHCKLDVKFRSFNTHKKSIKHMNALKLTEALKKLEENNQPVKK
jgi:hypothetical protein